MRCMRCLGVTAGMLVAAGWLCAAGPKSPATTPAKTRSAKPALPVVTPPEVADVLASEQKSALDRRAKLLSSSLPQARWHAGFVKQGDDWTPFESVQPSGKLVQLLAEYDRRRAKVAATAASAESQLELAEWCRRNELFDQERVHLMQVLAIAPGRDNTAVYRRLGYLPLGNGWISPEQFAEWSGVQQQIEQSLKVYGPKLNKLALALSTKGSKRQQAVEDLEAVRDPEAVPAIEWTLCGRDETTAQLGARLLSNIDTYESSLALARQSVFNKWPAARQTAANALPDRTLEDFVPALLGLLATPVQGRFEIAQENSRGVLFYNYVLARETDDQFQVATLRTIDFRVDDAQDNLPVLAVGGRSVARSTVERGQRDTARAVRDELYVQEKLIEKENERTAELNGRVVAVLEAVSGETAKSDPREHPAQYWDWWNGYNEMERKEKRVARREQSRITGDSRPPTPETRFMSGGETSQPPARGECFGAGTPVWTAAGRKPIEAVRPGDRVLTQDLETGELSYQPVLQTTIRPPAAMLYLTVGNDVFTVTGGHRFWISGQGWQRARDLKVGTLLHSATASVPVDGIEPAKEEASYNLVVARTNTYFVGEASLLTHDVTLPKSTNRKVPGLVVKP